MIYLASPYSHPDPTVRQRRFERICKIAAELVIAGKCVFCPIAMSHSIAIYGGLAERDSEYWERLNAEWMGACSEVQVAKMNGWEDSRGVRREISMAHEFGLPVKFLEVAE